MMSFKNIIKLSSFIGLYLAFSACSEELDISENVLNNLDYITINFDIPEPEVEYIGTRAENTSLTSVKIFAYTSATDYTISTLNLSNGSVSIKKDNNVQWYEFVGNYSDNSEPKTTFTTFHNCYWGYLEKPSSNVNEVSVTLLSNSAKVSVEKLSSVTSDFTLDGFLVVGTADEGSVGPALEYLNSDKTKVTNITTKDGLTYTYNLSSGKVPSDPTVSSPYNTSDKEIFETPAGKGRVLIKGTYKEKVGYYPVRFATRNSSGYTEDPEAGISYSEINLLRNYIYKVQIDYVRAEGWSTPQEAFEAEPDNRLSVLITETSNDIKHIMACRDYAIGVESSKFSVAGDQTSKEIYVVHSYKKDDSFVYPTVKYRAQIDDGDWKIALKDKDTDEGTESGFISKCVVTPETGEYSDLFQGTGTNKTPGKKYKVTFTLTQNTDDINEKTAYVKVSVGDLEIDMVFTQEARDYLSSEDRKAELYIPGYNEFDGTSFGTDYAVTTNYFEWIKEECKGVIPEANRNQERNRGLIFPPLPLYGSSPVVYRIPKTSSSETCVLNSSNINKYSVSSDANYWIVKLNSPSDTQKINTTDVLTITSGTDVINYYLYCTGFFHELDDNMIKYQASEKSKTGWYYYEFAKVGDQYILDRNIGAESNSPYISTYQYYTDESVGGYFQVAKARASIPSDIYNGDNVNLSDEFWNRRDMSDQTIIENLKLNLGQLHIPTKKNIENLNISLEKPSEIQTLAASTAAIVVDESAVEDGLIFIPHGGYIEGSLAKMTTRANIWTSTLYSETQGYFPEYVKYSNVNYGFWYYYLDGQPKSESVADFNQLRCNDATDTDFNTVSFSRYMPLRLVWGASGSYKVTKKDPAPATFANGDKLIIKWNNQLEVNGSIRTYPYIYVANKDNMDNNKFIDGGDNTSNSGVVVNTQNVTLGNGCSGLRVHVWGNTGSAVQFQVSTTEVKYLSGLNSTLAASLTKSISYDSSTKTYTIVLWGEDNSD